MDAIKVSPIARFKEDLDLDSLDAVEVVMAIEEEFGIEIPDSEADKILSISDAVAYISSHPMAKWKEFKWAVVLHSSYSGIVWMKWIYLLASSSVFISSSILALKVLKMKW